uniref:DIX domain containing 1a n=1 Tax=Callorhinchus milii TaxID=7868 RepID=A0A4W3IHA6_CALMI
MAGLAFKAPGSLINGVELRQTEPSFTHQLLVHSPMQGGGLIPVSKFRMLPEKEDNNSSGWNSMTSGKTQENDDQWEDQLLDQQDQLGKEMEEARQMISILQALLLNGSLPEDEQEGSFPLSEQGACSEEQLVIIKGRLDQSMEECQELKKELLKYKQESRNLQGVKDALQQRMVQQESSILQLKQELLRMSMAKDELFSQNLDLQRKIEERSRLLGEFKRELGQKDRMLQQHQAKLEEAVRKLAEASHIKTDDLQIVRDSLRSLRNNFSNHDPQHHTIDTLEQGIASLLERMHIAEIQGRGASKPPVKPSMNRGFSTERESWSPNTKAHRSHASPGSSSTAYTKVVYFTDRSLVPFMVNIPKRLGEVALKDFKEAIDREGNYRYHFKALDPEFGTVKEELFHDHDIVPGWEGKIVGWVEEDPGDGR